MRRLWRDVLDKVAPYDAGMPLEALEEQLGLGGILRLSANENPLGPSPLAIEALRREAVRVHLYPDGGATVLRARLAERLGIGAEWIMAGNGADEVLDIIARAAFDPGDEVVIPHPAFEPYATAATLSGATVVLSPLKGYDTDLDDMLGRLTPRTKAVVLCTPHNPASTLIGRRALEGFLGALGDDPPLVILDEAYRDFADDPDTADGVELARRHPTVIALRTFSKIAGLAGLRLGYAITRPESIERLNRVRAPYNVNRLAQAAAVAALDDTAHLERTRRVVLEQRPRLAAELARRGAPSPPSQANFLLVNVGGQAGVIRAALLKGGIIVRDGAGVGFPGHLRISIGTREQNNRLLEVWDRAKPPSL
ncbi:MAG TPA: histidinol-phosphate transaminase [Methylomirabilota bacterium]|nr:histidinol-phosphate transaminase [Methylomirabilota bacterium]